jgi:PA14 domain
MTAPPFDLGPVPTQYTARFMGQLRIDQDGMYTLAATTGSTDDTTELFIDGHLVAQANGFAPTFPSAATLPLTAGWHGIVVELDGSQEGPLGNADPHVVTLATTISDVSGAAVPIAADHLRPAAMSGYFSLAFSRNTALADTNTNGGVTDVVVPTTVPTQPPGSVIDSALYGYFFQRATPSDYTIALDMFGTVTTIAPMPFQLTYGDETEAGKPVPTTSGAWTYTFTDTVSGSAQSGPSAFGVVVLTSHGGPQMPFAPMWTYTSGPRALGDGVTGWGPLTVTGALAGATLAVSIRAAATADALANAQWVDVANGAVPLLPPSPFIEYRLEVTSDGWAFPTIDKVRLDYQR